MATIASHVEERTRVQEFKSSRERVQEFKRNRVPESSRERNHEPTSRHDRVRIVYEPDIHTAREQEASPQESTQKKREHNDHQLPGTKDETRTLLGDV
jgi:hypothetical protein